MKRRPKNALRCMITTIGGYAIKTSKSNVLPFRQVLIREAPRKRDKISRVYNGGYVD
jgi:hypothetical protein